MHRRAASYALAVMFAVNLVNFYDRQVIGVVGEAIKSDWKLNDKALGLINVAFTLIYAVVGLPFGRWADFGRRTRILALGIAVWSVFTALSGLTRNYLQMFAVRLGVGLGEAACAPAATSIIGDYFRARERGRALSVFMLGLPLGLALAYAVSGPLAKAFGWQSAFFVAALPGVACLIAVAFVKEPQRGAADQHVAAAPRGWEAYRRVLSIPTIWWIIVSGAIHNFNMYIIGAYQTSLLVRYHYPELARIDALPKAAMLSMVCTLFGVPGLLLGGYGGDLAYRRSPAGRLNVGALGIALCVPPWLAAIALPPAHPYAFAALAAAGTMLMYFYYSTVYSTVQDVIEPELRGTAMALYFMFMYPLGASLGPLVGGALSDWIAEHSQIPTGLAADAFGLRQSMFLVPGLFAGLAAVLFAGSRTVARDVVRRDERMRAG